jgi:ABC-2 type transport system permease protein
MRNIILVAKREYIEHIRGRAFRVSTVLVPLLIAGMTGLNYLTASHAGKIGTGKHIAIAADDPTLAAAVSREIANDTEAGFTVDVTAPATPQQRADLLNGIAKKSIDGLLSIDGTAAATPHVTLTYQASSGLINTTPLTRDVNHAIAEQRMLANGISQERAESLLKDVDIETLEVGKNGKTEQSHEMAPFYNAMAAAFLITMPILLYGMDMGRAIVEEKSSRIFEVMLSVTRADDLLFGKLIGVGAVGLTQIGIWIAAAILLTGSSILGSVASGNFTLHLSIAEAALFPVFFIMGFFLYSAFFSGLAATCETAQDLQMYMPLAIIPTWISFGIIPVLLNNPNSKWAVAASLFPPTAPFVMLSRTAIQTPPVWQIALSIALLAISIWAVVWFASRLYNVGILMYGKRATLPELMRWLRYS